MILLKIEERVTAKNAEKVMRRIHETLYCLDSDIRRLVDVLHETQPCFKMTAIFKIVAHGVGMSWSTVRDIYYKE